jgi:acyl-CoA reductase-like NAD-dependent aldehyde dehydrogenase
MEAESSTMTEAATPITTAPDFSSMFADLKASFETERTMNLAWRAEQLTALEHMMEECEQEFMDALKSDLGCTQVRPWQASPGGMDHGDFFCCQ